MKTKLQSFNFNTYLRYMKLFLMAGDLILLNIAYLISFVIRYGNLDSIGSKDSQIFIFISNVCWLFLIYHFKEFTFHRTQPIENSLSKTIRLIFYLFLSMATFSTMFYFHHLSRAGFIIFFLNFAIFTLIYRIVSIQFLKKIRQSGNNFRNVIIVGSEDNGKDIYDALTFDLSQGYNILGYFDEEPKESINTKYLGRLNSIYDYALENSVHEIYVALKDFNTSEIKHLISFCERNLIRIKFIPDYKLFKETNNVSIDFYGNVPVVSLRLEPLELPLNRIKKRFFDIFFSLVVILLIFPWLFPILMLMVKISSPGPIFFKQKRTGEGNREFNCWKFRSMRVNNDSDSKQASAGDNRITPIGKFLRKTNLDEMPQFFNVLIGNMSVVGPRPHMVKHTNEYSELIDNYLVRHFARPGITGWAQTNGLRGETKNVEKMAKRIEYDIWYIENWSFLLELKIIYFTIKNMITGDKNAV
ncbi:MAG: undecaprenyl-phosphate glucose phosphotransferase [Bacteroidia bacterium]